MSNLKKIKIILLVVLFFPVILFAQENKTDLLSSYLNVSELGVFNVQVPTVVELNLSGYVSGDVAVYNKTKDKFENNRVIKEHYDNKAVVINFVNGVQLGTLVDDSYSSFHEFEVDQNGVGTAKLQFVYDQFVSSDNLKMSLGEYVALPTSITISYLDNNGDKKIALLNSRPTDQIVHFPKISSKNISVDLKYSQPLRINELDFEDEQVFNQSSTKIRFLASPENEYIIYTNPDRYKTIPLGEAPNLSSNDGVLFVGNFSLKSNDLYVPADIDSDGVIDQNDNCVNVSNPDQLDVNNNGRGDVCDDYDKDGVLNYVDNCQNDPNKNQADIDNDGLGDVCDGDESRITEKYPILVWGGIIFAVMVFVVMYTLSFRGMLKKKEEEAEITTTQEKDNVTE